MRLIDADALMEKLVRYFNAPHVNNGMIFSNGMKLGIRGCIDILSEQKIEKAVPVVRGQWFLRNLDSEYKSRAICSKCGWIGVETDDGLVKFSDFNYCPHCGAKMDGKEEN